MMLIAIVKGCKEYKLPILNLPLDGLSTRRNRSLTQQTLFPMVTVDFSLLKKMNSANMVFNSSGRDQ
jgi:hypothetical protein